MSKASMGHKNVCCEQSDWTVLQLCDPVSIQVDGSKEQYNMDNAKNQDGNG